MADSGLEDAVRRGDPDRWLASRFIGDAAARSDVLALLAFDLELARASRVTSNPLTAEMRLVWWGEVVVEIYQGQRVRPHPTALALATAIQRRGLVREGLEAVIEARRLRLFEPVASPAGALAWADGVPGAMAVCCSQILDPQSPAEPAALAGRVLGLGWLLRTGAADGVDLRRLLVASLAEANQVLATLSPDAFPAVAAASLARFDLKGASPNELSRRLRMIWAVARGRI